MKHFNIIKFETNIKNQLRNEAIIWKKREWNKPTHKLYDGKIHIATLIECPDLMYLSNTWLEITWTNDMYAALSGLYSCTFVQCSLYAHCTHPSATYIILVYKSKTSVHIRKVHHSNCDSLYIFHGLHELSSENGEYCACVCNVYTFANHWQKAK